MCADIVLYFYKTTPYKLDFGWTGELRTVPPHYSPFLWRCRKNSCCVLRQSLCWDYTVHLFGTWQGFVVSHTFLDNMADLLIWHGVHPCHLITILILKRQHPSVRETDAERERQYIWGERKIGMNPQTDGACMKDEQRKAIHFTLGASLGRLKTHPLHCSDKTYVFSSFKPSSTL